MSHDLMPNDRLHWDGALDALAGDTEKLAEHLRQRWRANAPTIAPGELRHVRGFFEEYGWSAALEAYLLGIEVANDRVQTLLSAFERATDSSDDADLQNVWLGDLLALRRAPPVSRRIWFRKIEEPNVVAATLILRGLSRITNRLPLPVPSAYAQFSFVYDMIATALVNEVVESDVSTSLAAMRYAAGTRVTPPDSRSVFQAIAANRVRLEGACDATTLWADLIEQLVDGLIYLNDGLELIGAPAGSVPFSKRPHPSDFEELLPRMLDSSFYRFLAADPRIAEKRDWLTRALECLHEREGRSSPPGMLFTDIPTVQAVLWGNRAAIDHEDDGLVEQEGGVIGVSEEVERIEREMEMAEG
jgi:hypothetical protein